MEGRGCYGCFENVRGNVSRVCPEMRAVPGDIDWVVAAGVSRCVVFPLLRRDSMTLLVLYWEERRHRVRTCHHLGEDDLGTVGGKEEDTLHI